MTSIKICGITNKEDALAASALGIDAIGFIFYPKSPRFIEPTRAAEIIALLPPFVTPVGVFVDEEDREIRQILRRCGLSVLQFHGSESPAFCQTFREKVIKAFRVKKSEAAEKDPLLSRMQEYAVDAILLDTFVEDQPGGTGTSFDWEIAREAQLTPPTRTSYSRVILSGGLNPSNVVEAIQRVKPYAVDVSSGVEISPGKKDPDKMRAFVEAVHAAKP